MVSRGYVPKKKLCITTTSSVTAAANVMYVKPMFSWDVEQSELLRVGNYECNTKNTSETFLRLFFFLFLSFEMCHPPPPPPTFQRPAVKFLLVHNPVSSVSVGDVKAVLSVMYKRARTAAAVINSLVINFLPTLDSISRLSGPTRSNRHLFFLFHNKSN